MTGNGRQAQAIGAMMSGLEVARKVHAHMTVGMLHLLLLSRLREIEGREDDLELTRAAHAVGIPYSTFMRQSDTMGGRKSDGNKGLGLVEKVVIPNGRKNKKLRTTQTGRHLVEDIAAAFDSAAADEAGTLPQEREPAALPSPDRSVSAVVEALRSGRRARRPNWPAGRWIAMAPSVELALRDRTVRTVPDIALHTAGGDLRCGWTFDLADVSADDWRILD